MARSTQVVLDASVVVKWYVGEPDSPLANGIKDDLERGMIEVLVPSLLFYEVLNVLRYKRDMGEADLTEVVRSLNDLQLTIMNPNLEYGQEIVQMAMQRGISVYDASYIALALIKSCFFFTADEKLREKTQEENCVHLLQDYESTRIDHWKFPNRSQKTEPD